MEYLCAAIVGVLIVVIGMLLQYRKDPNNFWRRLDD